MNKELINKYWEEFCHWKDDGSILCKYIGIYPDGRGWQEKPDVWETKDEYVIIINDEYVEYRKALVEGKTIEYMVTRSGNKFSDWETMRQIDFFNRGAQYYRIKPDEPEFKVGDYVVLKRDCTTIVRVAENTMLAINGNEIYREWTLEEADGDEWVKYWHKNDTIYHGCSVAYFNRFVKDSIDDNYIVVPDVGQTAKQLGLEK